MKYLLYIYRKLWFFYNKVFFKSLGYRSFIYPCIKITKEFISIGSGVYIFKNCRIEGIRQWNNSTFSPSIEISDNVTIQQSLHLTCASKIYIGKNTAIAANVTITDINHKYLDVNIPVEMQDIEIANVYISDNCKIYNNSVILPSTFLGKHCIVGANSVVSGVFPDYCVIVGAPAKVVKKYCFNKKKWISVSSEIGK